MPQAIVLSERKCPSSRSVSAPIASAGEAGHDQRQQQSDPRRQAHRHGRPGRGIGGDADKGGLSERRHAADAGQQHQAERDQRGDADIVEQRDGETAEQGGAISSAMMVPPIRP